MVKIAKSTKMRLFRGFYFDRSDSNNLDSIQIHSTCIPFLFGIDN